MDGCYKAIPEAPTSATLEEPLPGDSEAFIFVRLPIDQPPGPVRASPAIEPSGVLSEAQLRSTPGAANIPTTRFVLQRVYVPRHRKKSDGALGGTRTHDLSLRRAALYPDCATGAQANGA